MGKVVVKIKLTNQGDLVAAHRKLSKAKPRTAEAEARVDTRATRLYLQSGLIKTLGLHKESEVQSKTTNGVRRPAVFEPVRMELSLSHFHGGPAGRVGSERPGLPPP